ncbi:MAG: GAF domain-containing protein [Balneolaceae bacterium]
MSHRREEQSLREFKQIISDLITLLAQSVGAHTVYMNWVNRDRRQFVMEASITSHSSVMFRDRVPFEEHFLFPWADIRKPVLLEISRDLEPERLMHYYDSVPVTSLLIVPFVNRSETVALTVLESEDKLDPAEVEASLSAYQNALGNVLNTYLELTDLHEKQQEWTDYEEGLARISPRLHKVKILSRVLEMMQVMLPTGGASLVARGMGQWVNVLNSSGSSMSPDLGLRMDEKSMVYTALRSGQPEFAIHFNQNPKRISVAESGPEGATLAIPLLIDDHRHGAILAYDQNPLVYSHSVRHKLVNLVRIASLALRPSLERDEPARDLLVSEYGSFIPDLWEKGIASSGRSAAEGRSTWFGFVTLEDLQALRARFRLEELKQLQRELISVLNPSLYRTSGYMGFYSDYVFAFLIQDSNPSAVEEWVREASDGINKEGITFGENKVSPVLRAGYVKLNEGNPDSYAIVQKAKRALGRALQEESLVASDPEPDRDRVADDI